MTTNPTTLSLLDLQAVLAALEAWAPVILAQGRTADPDNLREIIRLRALADRDTPVFLEAGNPAPFFQLLRADRACADLCATLLFLPREDAEAMAASVGHTLNAGAWYGVHLWESTDSVSGWLEQAMVKGHEVHPAEAIQAMNTLWADYGREWGNRAFVHDDGFYRAFLEEDVFIVWLSAVLKARFFERG